VDTSLRDVSLDRKSVFWNRGYLKLFSTGQNYTDWHRGYKRTVWHTADTYSLF